MQKFSNKINERLILNKNSKIKTAKSLKDLKEGDNIYFVIYMLTDVPKIEIGIITQKLTLANDKYYFLQYENNKKEICGILINKEYIDKNPDISSYEMCGVLYCSDRELIEKAVDNHIDEKIKPLQNEIEKLQEKINNLLKEKENKYK